MPESTARDLPAGVVALGVSEPVEELETAILWRSDDASAVAAAFREVARTPFESERGRPPPLTSHRRSV